MELKQNNMGTPFKMKGSPMQRNFGIGSPMKELGTLAIIGLSALASGIVGGASTAVSSSAKAKKKKKLLAEQKASDALLSSQEGITESVDKSGKTNLLAG